ncbi:MAG: hypothetical protein KF770_01560 [Anaerolineae bacterium]|nr:hypothetical protein [Anaerolineae bacterium]
MSPNQLKSAFWCVLFCVGTAVLLTLLSHQPHPVTAQDEHAVYLPLVSRPIVFTRGNNLLLNPSFEGEGDCQINPPNPDLCWYHPGGIPELQIPIRWVFTWQTGPTGFGNEPWDVWVRPEVRVLPAQLLPPPEHPLFIWDGNNTLKVFKGYGAISYVLEQYVWLEAGTYVMEVSIFPDLVEGYDSQGNKIPASDPLSGEIEFRVGSTNSGWVLPSFLDKNTYYFVFVITQAAQTEMRIAIRGRYAIQNNGWFMDDWWLWRQDDLTLPPGVYTRSGQPALLSGDVVPPAVPYSFPVGNPAMGADE